MSKRHFIALADTLRRTKPIVGHYYRTPAHTQWEIDVEAIAVFCRSQNSAFNYERWIGYINGENGPNGGAIK